MRGRDIRAYHAPWQGRWLIATFPAQPIDIESYPAIERYLRSLGRRLHQTGEKLPDGGRARKRTPHAWWELQDACAYHEKFARPKLLWIELVNEGRFAIDETGIFCDATAFMLTGKHLLNWLCAALNSPVAAWFLRHAAPTSGAGALRWKKAYVERIPVPHPHTKELRRMVDGLVDHIRRELENGATENAGALQQDLELLVIDSVYGLSTAEAEVMAPYLARSKCS